METRREERLQRLVQALKKTDKIHLKQAALLLGVSEMTIRRDLSSEPSSIVLLGGYVVTDPGTKHVTRYFVSDQKTKNVTEKRYIGELAAKMVEEDDIIFFDCGTTSPFIIDAIADELKFTAICHSLNTFLALQDKPNCKVILCGGEFRPETYVFMPIDNSNALDALCPTKAFISAAGIHMTHGLTCYTLDEVRVKNRALDVAQQNILVADHSKFGQTRPARFGALNQLHHIVTDRTPPPEFQDFFSKQNIGISY